MQTITTTRSIPPPGASINIDTFGGTLVNNSPFPIFVNGTAVNGLATVQLPVGPVRVSIECSQTCSVTLTYQTNEEEPTVLGSVVLSGPVQIGTNATTLGHIRLLASRQITFGVTYYDENGDRTGSSASLTVNAGGGASVALPSVPTNAVTAKLVHDEATSVTLYVDVQGAATSGADFTTNYLRYPRKLVTSSVGTTLGA